MFSEILVYNANEITQTFNCVYIFVSEEFNLNSSRDLGGCWQKITFHLSKSSFCDFHRVFSHNETTNTVYSFSYFWILDFKMQNSISLFCFGVYCLCPNEFLTFVCRYLIMLQTNWSINILTYLYFSSL